MSYKILEAKIEYNNRNEIMMVTLLVDFSTRNMPYSDVRAIRATGTPAGGYFWIPPTAILSNELLQQVAGQGAQVWDGLKLFPGWKKRFKR